MSAAGIHPSKRPLRPRADDAVPDLNLSSLCFATGRNPVRHRKVIHQSVCAPKARL